MKAITLVDGRCLLADVPEPDLGPDDVRIRVQAAGVNRADLVQKAGRYAPPPGASTILGLECAGVILEVGPAVTRWREGDPVCALLAGGGYAEQVVVHAGHVVPRPPGLDAVQAAAVVEVFATAWLNLMREGGLAGRDRARVVVHAGGSGVGTAAVQIGRAWGHDVFVTAGSDDKIAKCRTLGAVGGVNRHTMPWRRAVEGWAPDGVDVILDPVGASYLADNLACLATEGRLVNIGLLSGRTAEIDLGRVLVKRLRLQGSTLRSRSDAYKTALMEELRHHVWPKFADRTLRPVVHGTFPLARAEAAHASLASNDTFGALVLEVG